MISFWVVCMFFCLACVNSMDLPECKKHECMEYEVIETTKNYEVRRYKTYKLASITSKGMPWFLSDFYNFRRLFKFIKGANSKRQPIPMTIPVMNFYTMKGDGKVDRMQSQMTFVMPKAITGSVPQPTDDKVKIIDFGPVTVYAVRFGGWITSDKIFKLGQKLRNDLKADGVSFDESTTVTAGYNSPMEFWDRHNDIFYMAKENASINQ